MATNERTYEHWRLEEDGAGIAWLTLDKAESTANSLSRPVLEELDALLNAVAAAPPKALVIHSGKTGGFIAGADVREFTTISDEATALVLIERGQSILAKLAALPLPTIALIHGFCLGGGLELALACRYRVASDDPATRLGCPEVQLGIHPGFGGTVRLTALVGSLTGMELMLTARTLAAKAALKIGLVDYALPRRHLENAARAIVFAPPPRRPLPWRERLAALLPKALLAGRMRSSVAKKADRRHYPAPYALIALWQSFGANEAANYAAEAASVARLITGSTARNLLRVFLLQEELKATGRGGAMTPRRVHVVGGGTMGGDIAIWCALQGLEVTIQDLNTARLGQVVKRGAALFSRQLKEARPIQAALDRLLPDPAGDGVAHADLVIEAIFEDAEAKRELYRQLEPRLRPEAILATNTSSIPLQELASALARPERLIGLHFFNPVDKMQLVEVVSTTQTDPAVVQSGAAFVLAIKRLPLAVSSSPGFLVNRILMPYLLEAVTLVEEGRDPTAIDRAAIAFGMPMGPIRLADTVGLDICLSVATILARHYPVTVPAKLRELVAAGHLGRKSGQGFYAYRPGASNKGPEGGVVDTMISDRLMFRLLNEAVACWREGVVSSGDRLDAGVIFGTGFAPFRGGPLQHIKASGAATLLARLQELEQAHGSRFTPDAGWQELVVAETSRA
jgi:3-hydroxyacyl-CoA dehydrogenase / enoyl-CoA hydratase / 3-hydroxybutyryl-CoA epimerase